MIKVNKGKVKLKSNFEDNIEILVDFTCILMVLINDGIIDKPAYEFAWEQAIEYKKFVK